MQMKITPCSACTQQFPYTALLSFVKYHQNLNNANLLKCGKVCVSQSHLEVNSMRVTWMRFRFMTLNFLVWLRLFSWFEEIFWCTASASFPALSKISEGSRKISLAFSFICEIGDHVGIQNISWAQTYKKQLEHWTIYLSANIQHGKKPLCALLEAGQSHDFFMCSNSHSFSILLA